MAARTVLHVDLDAFYASVEQRDRPELRGRPVIVGGDRRRGVVCAASYEARRFGVKSAMPMAEAVRRCPSAVVLPLRMERYAAVSTGFFGILARFSPLVEGLSLDEAFLDVTGEERLFGDGVTIARAIKQAVREELSLVASVGVAPVKLVAKIASDLGKPDGLLRVAPGEVERFLAPLPVARLWGVGKATEVVLAKLGLRTLGDLVDRDPRSLVNQLGATAVRRLQELARGLDDRPVEPDRARRSVGHEETFATDLFDRASLRTAILAQADRASSRLRASGARASVVTLKIKRADHTLVTRRETLPRATGDGRWIAEVACALFARVPAVEERGVRLTGVSLSGLEDGGAGQLGFVLDDGAERGERLGATLDRIESRFGDAALRRAVHLGPPAKRPRSPGPSR